MATANGEAAAGYGRLLGKYGDVAARSLDRSMVLYARELLGTLPRGSARRSLEDVPIDADAFLDGLGKIFHGGDILEAACALLDHSAARACAPRSKDSGVIYTPLPVARYICNQAIGSYLLKGIGRRTGGSYPSAEGAIESLGAGDLRLLYDDLRGLRVFDSSCGSGVFLQAALEELYRLRARVLGYLGEPAEPDMRDIMENSLYGMDVEPYSVEVAALRLGLLAGSRPSEDWKYNLACENALFLREAGPFDVIVGNPPYMRVKSMFSDGPGLEGSKKKKDFADAVHASRLYRYQEGNLNLYKLFVERNLSFLNDGGSMGLIIPSSFLNEATSMKLRKHIFDTCQLEEVIEIPERSRLFKNVNQATAILVFNKSRASGSFRLRLGAGAGDLGDGSGAISIGYKELDGLTSGRMEVPLLRNPSLEWDMIKRLKSIPPFKGGGVPPVGEISVGHVDETIDREYVTEVPTGDIFVKGIHLKEYAVDLSPGGRQPRWVRKADFLKSRPSALPVISQWRIIGRNTQNKACSRRLKFALLPPGYLCSNSIKQIVMADAGVDPFYLLGLLNSSVLNWYFELFCSQNNIRNYNIEALPLPRAPGDVQEAFARVSGLVMGSAGEARGFLDLELMDAMAYELYFKDHIRLIPAIGGLREFDDTKFILRARSDEAILRQINGLMREEPFKVIREAAFKPKAKNYI